MKDAGVKEIVLTGINLGDFGKDGNGEKTGENFYSLLQTIEENDGVERYRISSIEPNLLTEDIIQFVAKSKKIMPHFHIPLQSGSNKILGLMRRRYKRELYAERIAMIKKSNSRLLYWCRCYHRFSRRNAIDDFKDTVDFLICS